MTGLIARSKPTMLIEVLTGDAGSALLDMLDRYGYSMYEISETDGLEPIAAIRPKGRGGRNVLFCQPDIFEAAGLADLLSNR